MNPDLSRLPADLPRPVDDGVAAHLEGLQLPDVALPSTSGATVTLASLSGRWVLYIYSLTGRPGVALPEGWDMIPGARGCTPESCSFRDHFAELQALHTNLLGVSTQTSEYQREVRERLHLPFHLLSDHALRLRDSLRLPTFAVDGMELYKRLTLIVEQGRIRKTFYPVFPADTHVDEVLACLRRHRSPLSRQDTLV